jgi:hypothetical protein
MEDLQDRFPKFHRSRYYLTAGGVLISNINHSFEGRAWVGEVCTGPVCEWSGGGGRMSGVKRCVVCGVGKMGEGRCGCRTRTGGGLWFY